MADALPAPPSGLELFLRPISPDAPSGRSLRYEPLYDQIREARREDDATLPQGVWQTTLKRANWAQVSEICQQALAHETKDLQLAAWLTEAWGIQQGFAGVERGLQLLAALVEHFWDSLWPALEDDDVEARLAPLSWLDDRLPSVLCQLPLVQTQGPDAASHGFADWQRILHQEKQGGDPESAADQGDPATAERGPLTRETFLAIASSMPASALGALARQVDAALAASSTLEQQLDARLGKASGLVRRARSCLDDIQALATTLRGSASQEEPGEEAGTAPDTEPSDRPANLGHLPRAIRSREDAFRLLNLASEYLRRTEPHSPVAYLVKRAVHWGQMPLDQLLEELIPNASSLEALHSLLGMKSDKK
ncbi:type VI secretion system protein TssA [Hyalangium versicolor]|uniref:type VI secretion system protein TssA n=1 Tax=Hyalangium versicolor TaxID=2861190 RepID=UPI001CCCEA84|nr:type VI secretion system protein TssA [Hyalangium versicolor]